jgi:hypothetical protein
MNLHTVYGEFYHGTATCAGSMTPDMPAAMDLLRLAVEGGPKTTELGTVRYTLKLSERRSDAVVKHLADHGIAECAGLLRRVTTWPAPLRHSRFRT